MHRFENSLAPVFSIAIVVALACLLTLTNGLANKQMKYDNFFGTKVEDPFRWLEDDVRESEEVRSWVEDQNEVTFKEIDQLPYRKQIEARLTKLWDYEKYGVPFKRGDQYFYYKNDGLQNQSVLYKLDSLDAIRPYWWIPILGPMTAPMQWAGWRSAQMESSWLMEFKKPDRIGEPGRSLK